HHICCPTPRPTLFPYTTLFRSDAIALGEADYTWPQIVTDAATGSLKEIYRPVVGSGQEMKPTLADYPQIPWDTIPLEQFNLVGKDRKSTRLNSSHVSISYAVFC